MIQNYTNLIIVCSKFIFGKAYLQNLIITKGTEKLEIHFQQNQETIPISL